MNIIANKVLDPELTEFFSMIPSYFKTEILALSTQLYIYIYIYIHNIVKIGT